MRNKKLQDYTTDELVQELRNRKDVWAVKVWTRADVEDWLNDNLQNWDNDDHDHENQRELIITTALGNTANLDDACETDWATVDYYMSDLLKTSFGANIKTYNPPLD